MTDKQWLVVHWDEKIMADTTNKTDGKSKVHRLAVVVTGIEVEKILGIVQIPSGTGKALANAMHQLEINMHHLPKALQYRQAS